MSAGAAILHSKLHACLLKAGVRNFFLSDLDKPVFACQRVKSMSTPLQLVVFTLDEQRYALHLSVVERVVRAVEITPLPSAPDTVMGAINVEGRIVPVFSLRKRFGLPEPEIGLNDHLIIARTRWRTVALFADCVSEIVEIPADEVIEPSQILPELEHIEGVAKLPNHMVLIHNLERFLSIEERNLLGDAITSAFNGDSLCLQ